MDEKEFTSPFGFPAHHLIPLDMRSHPVFQFFRMDFDDATNGILLLTHKGNQHVGNHDAYSRSVREVLDRVWTAAQGIPDTGARNAFVSDKLRAIQKTASSALYEGASMISNNSKEVWDGLFSQI